MTEEPRAGDRTGRDRVAPDIPERADDERWPRGDTAGSPAGAGVRRADAGSPERRAAEPLRDEMRSDAGASDESDAAFSGAAGGAIAGQIGGAIAGGPAGAIVGGVLGAAAGALAGDAADGEARRAEQRGSTAEPDAEDASAAGDEPTGEHDRGTGPAGAMPR